MVSFAVSTRLVVIFETQVIWQALLCSRYRLLHPRILGISPDPRSWLGGRLARPGLVSSNSRSSNIPWQTIIGTIPTVITSSAIGILPMPYFRPSFQRASATKSRSSSATTRASNPQHPKRSETWHAATSTEATSPQLLSPAIWTRPDPR